MIDIKDIKGNVILSTPINEGSKRKFDLMQSDHITLRFSLDTPIDFPMGCYVDTAELGRFERIDSAYKPNYNNTTGGYDYELQLDAYYRKWKNKIFKFTPEVGGQEASWSLTASLDVQMSIFLRNLKALGYTYRGTEFEFSIDSTVENKAIGMTYDNMNMLDALASMAESWECEWWVTDNIIHFGRCEYGTPVDFEINVNVESMSRSESKSTYATRIYAFGSTKNLPASYRPVDESVVVNGVVQRRLMLPEGTPYVDAFEGMTEEEAVEQVVIFEDVYPRTKGTIDSIETYEDTVENEDGTTTTETFYRFKDDGITFSKDYILEGEELKVKFESGLLNGMEFGVAFNPKGVNEKFDSGSWNPEAQLFEIVANEDYGRKLPDSTLKPQVGDTYILSGWDSTKIAELGLVSKAENELLAKAQQYVEKSKVDPNTYQCKMMSDYMYGLDNEGNLDTNYAKVFEVGDKVNLINEGYFENGRQSRIIGYEYNLDYPYDSPIYTVGETASYSRIGDIETKLEALTYGGITYKGGGGSGVYLIGTNDTTKPTNRNTYSALRADQHFLKKDQSDTAKEVITFEKGLNVGEFVTGASGASFFKDLTTGQTIMELDKLYVRMKAFFETLTIVEAQTISGKQIISPAGSVRCTNVEEYDGYYRCYFLNEQDGEKIENKFIVGDQVYSQMFNAKTGTSNKISNRYYWRLVTGVGENYIDLSKTDCDADSDIPMVGDVLNHRGHRYAENSERMNFIETSTVDGFSPSITLFYGVNSFSLSGKDYVQFGVDKTTNKAFMNVYGDMYVGDRNKTAYMRYTQEEGLVICGKLDVGTKLGDSYLKDLISASTPEGYQEFVEKVTQDLEGLQAQIDGTIDSYFFQYEPSLNNYPASDWDTENEKKAHLNDTFTNLVDGRSWRWSLDGTYKWVEITDTATTKALALAGKAQDTADGKRRVFVVTDEHPTPYPPYDKGDLWSRGSDYPLMICVVQKESGVYADGDFDYADNTEKLREEMTSLVNTTKAELDSSISSTKKAMEGYTDDAKKALQQSIDLLEETKAEVENVYSIADADAKISAAEADAIKKAEELADASRELAEKNVQAWADGEITEAEQRAINEAQARVDAAKSELEEAIEAIDTKYAKLVADTKDELNNSIGQAKEAANKYADEGIESAKEDINASIAELERAKANVTEVYSKSEADGKITEAETSAINAAKAQADAAIAYYDTIVKAYADGVATEEELDVIAGAKAALDSAKKYAEEQAEAAKSEIENSYLFQALQDAQSTEIANGLVLTSLIQLRDTQSNIMSGINGLINANKGDKSIATWWGGDMLDLIDYYRWDGTQWVVKSGITAPSNIPSGLIRMDGTGYLAKGKFWWDNDGKIYADPTALFLSFDVNAEEGTLSATILDIRDKQTEFANMWTEKTDSNGTKYLYTTYPLVTQGGVTMYAGTSGLDVEGIYDGLPIDGSTIYWENGVLKAVGGGGTADSVAWENITGKPSFSTVATSGSYNDLLNKPTLLSSFTNDLGFVTESALSGKYLPLSGGVLYNGVGSNPLLISSAITTEASIGFRRKGETDNAYIVYRGGETWCVTDLGWTKNLTLLHSANYTSYTYSKSTIDSKLSGYLPLSGGTISGSYGALVIHRNTASTHGSFVKYTNTGGTLGLMGFGVSKQPEVYLSGDTSTPYTLLHSGNYSSYALPLTGGTIKNETTSPLAIDTTGTEANLRIRINGSGKASFGYKTGVGTWMRDSSARSVVIGDDGVLKYGTDSSLNTVYHTGNLTKLSQLTNDISLIRWSGNHTESVSSKTASSKFEGTLHGDANGFYLTGSYADSNAPTYYGNIINMMGQGGGQLYCGWEDSYTTGSIYYRSHRDNTASGGWTPWKQLAFTDSNVASATKLATARTIWGQSFDGSGNIDNVSLTLAKGKASGGWERSIHALSTSGSVIGAFGLYGNGDSFTYAYIGASYNSPWMIVNSSGNVGIGTTSPSYKLHVNGSLNATTIYQNGTSLDSLLGAKLNSSSYTASDVLAKLKTVDGSGSGLDADTLDGLHGDCFLYLSGGAAPNPNTYDGSWFGMTNQNTPDKEYMHILSSNCGLGSQKNSLYWATQLALPTQGRTNAYFRSGKSDGSGWNDWVNIVTSANIGNYNAGSATYATSAGNADTLDGFHAKGTGLSNLFKWGASSGGNLGGVWCKLASWSATSTETNTDVGFLLHSSFSNVYAHIICRVRKGEYAYLCAVWAYGIDESNIKLCYDDSISNFELWYYGGKLYSVVTAELLYESSRSGGRVDAVTMYSNNQGTPSLSNSASLTRLTLQNNVASATKLQTPRTIWGQSFDGSGNVDGDLNGVGRIIRTEPTAVDMDWAGNFIFKNLNSVASNYWHIDTANGNPIFVVHNNSNVGIGTTSPAYKLDVDGNLRVNSTIYGCFAVRDANGNWIVGKSDSDNGEVSLGSANKTQVVTLQNRAGSIYLNSSGSVGIGTTNPSQKLGVEGSIWANGNGTFNWSTISRCNIYENQIQMFSKSYGGYVIYSGLESGEACRFEVLNSNGGWTSQGWTLFQNGNITMGTTNDYGYKLGVTGSVYISSNLLIGGGITMYSARVLKNVVDERGLSLRELSVIKPTRYTWKDKKDDRLHIGGIADDIQQVLPEVVYRTPDGVLTMDYGNAAFAIASSLIKPMIEHESEIVSLKRRVRELEEEVKRLRA